MTRGLSLQPELRVEVTASTVLSAAMLAMPTTELRHTLLMEQDRNPALVVRRRPVCHRCHRALVAGTCDRCGPTVSRIDDEPAAVASAWERLHDDATTAAPHHLVEPVLVVLTALDDKGLLPQKARDALLRSGMSPVVLAAAVELLREAGPPGIAAATPAENLLLQLTVGPFEAAERLLARRLLTLHAESLADGDLPGIALVENCGVEVIEQLVTRMRRVLRPYPGLGESSAQPLVRARPPDLSFEAEGTQVRAFLPERETLALSVNPTCGEAREAHSLIGRVHRRWSLLQRLGDLLASHHGDRLLAGSSVFRPLTRAQAARLLMVHESTVSRAVAHRWAALVDGKIVALGTMFGSNHDAYAAVAELCASRPRPADREVADVLAERGIVISRRTVTKYRRALGL